MRINATNTVKIGRQPFVAIPLKQWARIADALEDLEPVSSPKYLRRIAHARAQIGRGEVIPLADILKEFGV